MFVASEQHLNPQVMEQPSTPSARCLESLLCWSGGLGSDGVEIAALGGKACPHSL